MADPQDPVEAVAKALLFNTFDREHEQWPPTDADSFRNQARAAISAYQDAMGAKE